MSLALLFPKEPSVQNDSDEVVMIPKSPPASDRNIPPSRDSCQLQIETAHATQWLTNAGYSSTAKNRIHLWDIIMMQTRSRSESRHRDDAPSSIYPPHPSMHTRQTPSNSGGTFMNSNDDASPSQQPHASVHDDQSHVTEHPSLLTIQIPSGTQIQQHEPPSTNT